MHNAAFAALGLGDWHYQRLPVPPGLLAATVRALARIRVRRRERHDPPQARRARARRRGQRRRARDRRGEHAQLRIPTGGSQPRTPTRRGCSRRSACRSRDCARRCWEPAGAPAPSVWALRRAGAAEVLVWNRTSARARELAAALGARAVEAPQRADLLVNCTSVGLGLERSATEGGALNQLGLRGDQIGEYSHVADLVYRPGSTALLAAAAAAGAHTIDGLEILAAQGALSFALWTGREPPAGLMLRAAREHEHA